MNYTENFENALKGFKTAPDKPGVFDSPFWAMLIETICDEIHENGSIDAFIKSSTSFINYGICDELHAEPKKIIGIIEDVPIKSSPLILNTFSGWITAQVNKIRQCDKRDSLVKELRTNQIQLSKYNRESQSLRSLRIEKFHELAEISQSPNSKSDLQKILAELSQIDQVQLDSFRAKKALSKGTFFTVEQKRDNAQREMQLTKSLDQVKSYLDCFPLSDLITEIKQSFTTMIDLLQKIVDLEQVIEKNQANIETVEKLQAELSPIEFENNVRKELEHIRDLTRLSAKRMHLDNCPVLTEGKRYFSCSKIIECLNRILEFDPQIFKNDRVTLFGRPEVIIVPGSGNALYDWQNNVILIPLIYTAENPMTSISTGMIEYRLDTDEDKTMLNSYNELPDNKNVRSSIQLKSQLTKDYTVWMTSEYMGYRVLAKSVKEWFEHEIGPNKNEIFIPHTYQPFNFSSADFNKQLRTLEERITTKGVESAENDDLWAGSIFHYNQGNFQRSYDLLLTLIKRNPANPMIFYNFAQVATKVLQRTNAIKGYTEFMGRLPQCWWTRVAGDHLRNLQSSGST